MRTNISAGSFPLHHHVRVIITLSSLNPGLIINPGDHLHMNISSAGLKGWRRLCPSVECPPLATRGQHCQDRREKCTPEEEAPFEFSSALMSWWASLVAWMDLKSNYYDGFFVHSLQHLVVFRVPMQYEFTSSVFNSLLFIIFNWECYSIRK